MWQNLLLVQVKHFPPFRRARGCGRLDAFHSVLANHGARLLEGEAHLQALTEHLGWQGPKWEKEESEGDLARIERARGSLGCWGDRQAIPQNTNTFHHCTSQVAAMEGNSTYRFPRSRKVELDDNWLYFGGGLFVFSQACYYMARTRGAQYNPRDIDKQVFTYAKWRFPAWWSLLGSFLCVGFYYAGSRFTLHEQTGALLEPYCTRFPQLVPLVERLKPPDPSEPKKEEVPLEFR
eukprot:symbB.v1.2.020019.t1/scaffold1662.1/size108665/7